MINILYFLLLPKIISATSFINYNISSVSAHSAEAAAESSYESSYSAGLFIDCSSYHAAHLASSNIQSAGITQASATPAAFKPATPTSIVPFEQYWCENWVGFPANTPDSFPNNGTLEEWFYNLNASDKEFCLSLEKANYSSWAAAGPTSAVFGNITESLAWEPTLTPPCCDTFCNIEASAVQLYFWPTPAPVPNVTTIVGADGFTFTSPSVYLVYKGVSAYGQCGKIGPTYASLTFPYEPSDISSFNGNAGTRLDYADLFSNCTARAADYSYTDPTCISSINWIDSPSCSSQEDLLASLERFDILHCYPYLDYPSGLQAVNPAWSTCVDTNYGGHFASVFDPPHALTPAPALGPVPTKLSSLPGAAPPSYATDPTPVKTASPKVAGPADGAPNHLPTDKSPLVGVEPPIGSDTPSAEDPPVGNDPSVDKYPFMGSASPLGNAQTDSSRGDSVRTGDPVGDNPRPSLANDPNDPVTSESRPLVPLLTPTKKDGPDPSVDSNAPQPSWAQGGDVSPQNEASVQEGPVLNFAGSIYTANQASQFLVAGETLIPGGIVTISGMPISVDPGTSIAVIGGSTQLLKGAAATPKPVLTFAGSVYTAGDSNNFIIAGKTLAKGGVIVVDGTRLSIDPSGINVVVGSSTQALSSPFITAGSGQRQVLTFHGSTYTDDGSSNFVVDGQTLAQGSAITADGTQLSYDQSRVIVGGTSTQILVTTRVDGPEQEPVLSFDGSTYSADSSSDFIIDGHTLSKGGIITVDGTRLSYDPQGSEVVIGTSTQSLATPGANTPQEEPLLTFDGSTFTADAYSDFVIDGQTLSKGAIITVDGTRLSYNQQGSAIVIGTSTQTLSFATITPAPTPTPIITFDGSTYYADDASSSEFVIDGQTLTKGGVVTVHGTPISYAVGGTDVVVGTSTEGVGLGGLIMDGFGGGGGLNSNGPVQFTGKAARDMRRTWGCWVLLWGSAGLCLVMGMGFAMS